MQQFSNYPIDLHNPIVSSLFSLVAAPALRLWSRLLVHLRHPRCVPSDMLHRVLDGFSPTTPYLSNSLSIIPTLANSRLRPFVYRSPFTSPLGLPFPQSYPPSSFFIHRTGFTVSFCCRFFRAYPFLLSVFSFFVFFIVSFARMGGSVAEWLACWTQAQ